MIALALVFIPLVAWANKLPPPSPEYQPAKPPSGAAQYNQLMQQEAPDIGAPPPPFYNQNQVQSPGVSFQPSEDAGSGPPFYNAAPNPYNAGYNGGYNSGYNSGYDSPSTFGQQPTQGSTGLGQPAPPTSGFQNSLPGGGLQPGK